MNWQRTRSFFPVTREVAYFNHAGVAPVSTRVEEALGRYCAEATRYGALRYDRAFDAEVERVRARAALLLGAQPDELAFVKNTTEGLGLVATGLDWRAGDQVVTCDLEYPSNVYPWWSLRERGVETLMLRGREGRLPPEDVEEALRSPRVRLLALSSVEFGSGARNDLGTLGRLCRERGVLFCVDAIQSLGCLPLDPVAWGIDFLAADGHKWMLGPEGAGMAYIRREHLERLRPFGVGWHSVVHSSDYTRIELDLKPSAARYEGGSQNMVGMLGFGASLDLLLDLGIEQIAAAILEITDRACMRLEQIGATIVSDRRTDHRSGIVAFELAGRDPLAMKKHCLTRQVVLSCRAGRLRISPHAYNNEEDLDRLVHALQSFPS